MIRFKRYAYRHLLPITFLFVLTGCYEIPPGQPQPFSCDRFGEAYWEAFRLGADSPDDVVATVVRLWSMDKENIQIEDGHDLWIDWSDSIETGLGAQYSALFREERRLTRIAMYWNQEDPLPSIVQVLDCLGPPQYFEAFYQMEPEATAIVVGLWYVEKGIVVEGYSAHRLALPSAIQPEFRMTSSIVVAPGSPEQMIPNVYTDGDDTKIQAYGLCRLRMWPSGAIEAIEIEEWSAPCNWKPEAREGTN